MKRINQFLDANIAKRTVSKMVPELAKRDDYETECRSYACPSCNEKNIEGAAYRFHNTDEWVDVPYRKECPDCENAIASKDVTDKAFLKRLNVDIDAYWSVPKELEAAGFKNYESSLNNVTANALNKCRSYTTQFLRGQARDKSLVLMGNPGTGKSHLSTAIARTVRDKGQSVGILTMSEIISKFKATINKNAEKTQEQVLEDIARFPILIIDDLGAEGAATDWAVGRIFDVINARIGKATVYSTNFNIDGLKALYDPFNQGGRIVSRLHNNTEFIDMYTDDYRKTKIIS